MAGNSVLQEKLKAGIEAARRGDKAEAQKLLRQVTDADARNEIAWMWLASVTENLSERRLCLEQALRINPNNTRAKQALDQLNAVLPPRASDTARRAPAARIRSASDSGGIPSSFIVIGALVALALLTAVIFSIVSNAQPEVPNAATQAAFNASLNTATPTATIDPADYTPTPFYGIIVTPSNLSTLPPSFTPTFTPTATETPIPTATPVPVSVFRMAFTTISGNGQAALFEANGDATNASQIGEASQGFADPAYDPTGQRVAFVRTVTYTSSTGNQVTAPELFVAPVDNLDAARQITQLGGTMMSRPTFAPDGIQIVFVSDYGGNENLWYITEDGNNLRPLTTSPGVDKDPAWSPNGDVIVYASDQANLSLVNNTAQAESTAEADSAAPARPSVLTELFTITPDGETITQLTDAAGSSYSPAWSPTGERIVFVSDRSGDGDVYIMTADGQSPFLLTVDDGGAEDRSPMFTPNGRSVVFLSNIQDDTFALYKVDVDGRNRERLGDVPPNIRSLTFLPLALQP